MAKYIATTCFLASESAKTEKLNWNTISGMLAIKLGKKLNRKFVIALGFFDAMHLGHLALVERTKQLAKEQGCLAAIYTFSNNHFETLEQDKKLIYTFNERLDIYQNAGVDVVVSSVFDKAFMTKTADEFLSQLLTDECVGVVCGFDFTCGGDRKSSQYVYKYCQNKSTMCEIVSQITRNGVKVSSSLVKTLLQQHKIEDVNVLLSERYSITGTVVSGRKVGRSLGFPTANVLCDSDKMLIDGVYSATTVVDGVQYKALLNVGAKPTFDIADSSVELHIIGYDGDLYGHTLKIYLIKYLRDIVKFATQEQLTAQLTQDKNEVLND
jgi:riboflavin kinase/FMN adenylyltransferase